MSEVYIELETFQLGIEVEDGCQAERGPAEQSLGSGLGAPALRGDPAPQTLHSLLSWHQSHQSLGFSSCYVKGPQWSSGAARTGGEVGSWALPHFPATLIDLVEQGSCLHFIQRKGSIAYKKFKNHKYRNQEK